MFTTEELQAIDRKYFTVIVADAYDVTLISNNTRHVWCIHNVELKDRDLCLVYHKHKISHPYHSHSRSGESVAGSGGRYRAVLCGRYGVLHHGS